MKRTTVRYEAMGKVAEPVPRHPRPLTAALQGLPPQTADLAAKAPQAVQIGGYRVIVEIALHHAAQPVANCLDGFVSPP